MSTNEVQNLKQSKPSRKTADVIENQNFSSPKRTVTVIIPSLSRLTDDGKNEKGTRKNETACDNQQQQQQQQRGMEDFADTLVPPACIIYAFCIGCLLHVLHLSVNAGMENARLLPVLLVVPPAFVLPCSNPRSHPRYLQTAVSHRECYLR